MIRTARPVWASRPYRALTLTSLGGLGLALGLALTPLGQVVGVVALPPGALVAIAGVCIAYLAAAEGLKHAAMRPGRAGGRRR